jgi:hypothetical protein
MEALNSKLKFPGEKPIYTITVPVKWRPAKDVIIGKLLRRELEQEQTFTIEPLVICVCVRIAVRVKMIPKEVISGNILEAALPLLEDHLHNMAYIIAAAIENTYLEPQKGLIEFIEKNFTVDQLFEGLHASLNAMNLQSFLDSIVLMKGTVNILKPTE